jgi:hypothetical protein
MNTIIKVKAGACAMLLGILTATSGPAVAKVTIACKNLVQSGATSGGTQTASQVNAKAKWKTATTSQYGHPWANFSKAKDKYFDCVAGQGEWVCNISARPCKQVSPLSSSAHHLKIQPLRLRLPRQRILLKRQSFAPLVRTQRLRSRVTSTAPQSLSNLRRR